MKNHKKTYAKKITLNITLENNLETYTYRYFFLPISYFKKTKITFTKVKK